MVFQTRWRAGNASYASLGALECDLPHCCSGEHAYSSFGGYARKSRQVDWIAFDEHQRYWLRRNGGKTRLCPTERSLRKDLLTQPIRRSNDSKIEFTENRIS